MKLHTLSQHLVSAWPNLSERVRADLAAMHKHYERVFTKLRDHPEQPGLAATLHDLVDEAVERQGKTTPQTRARVRCTRGCAHCCKQNVSITVPEAKLLLIDSMPVMLKRARSPD